MRLKHICDAYMFEAVSFGLNLCVCSPLDPKDAIGTKGALAATGGGMPWRCAVCSCL